MGLRLTEALSLQILSQEFGYDLAAEKSPELDLLLRTGFIEPEGGYFRLTPEVLFLVDEVILNLI